MQIPKKNKDDVERRFVANDVAEIRLKEEQDKPTKIVGYFAKFNKLSRNLGGFKEKIEPGFFADAIKNSDTVDLFNHDFNYILGRKSAGTLRVWEDDVGLAYECDAPTTQLIKDLVISPIRRGEITGNSFGFTMNGNGDVWEEDEEGRVVRTLKKNGCRSLIDGSQVVNPAYLDTSVALRSMEKWQEEKSGVKPRYEGDGTKPVEEETGKTDTTIDDIKAVYERYIKHPESFEDEVDDDKKASCIQSLKRLLDIFEPKVEPMQDDGEEKDEDSKPMQGEEARDVAKKVQNTKFKKYGMEIFSYEDDN